MIEIFWDIGIVVFNEISRKIWIAGWRIIKSAILELPVPHKIGDSRFASGRFGRDQTTSGRRFL